jgi:hypothetical protein
MVLGCLTFERAKPHFELFMSLEMFKQTVVSPLVPAHRAAQVGLGVAQHPLRL